MHLIERSPQTKNNAAAVFLPLYTSSGLPTAICALIGIVYKNKIESLLSICSMGHAWIFAQPQPSNVPFKKGGGKLYKAVAILVPRVHFIGFATLFALQSVSVYT